MIKQQQFLSPKKKKKKQMKLDNDLENKCP